MASRKKKKASTWLPVHLLQPILNRVMVIISFIVFILLEHDTPHYTTGRATACE
jgi:hypothetical protein